MIEGSVVLSDFDIAAKTDIGVIREENQDSFLVETPKEIGVLRAKGRLVAVADGMGGLRDGRVASSLAIKTLEESYFETAGDVSDALVQAVQEANRAVFERSASDGADRPMGSTLTALVLLPDSACIAHVGDSRAYLFRDGELRQITRDHSLANELIEQGAVADEALLAMHRHVLTRGIGLTETVEVDLYEIGDLQPGDLFLLSSDGLHDVVGDDFLTSRLTSSPIELSPLCDALIEEARLRGGPDNITALAVRLAEPETQAGAASHEAGPLRLESGTGRPEPTTRRSDGTRASAGTRASGGTRAPDGVRGVFVIAAVALAFTLGALGSRLWNSEQPTDPEEAETVQARIRRLLDDPALATSPELQAELERCRAERDGATKN